MNAVNQFWDYITTSDHWWGRRGLWHAMTEHVRISILAVLIAAALAVPLGLFLGHVRRGGVAVNGVVNIGRALSSYAIVVLLFPFSLRFGFQLGFLPTLVALVLLGLVPIFTNTYAGVAGVDPSIVEAARGMGMRPTEVLFKVETPNGLPLILAGIRTAAVQVIATATLGALVGFGGLGAFIVRGLATPGQEGQLMAGAVLVALLALLTEIALGYAERAATPWLSRRRQRVVDPVAADPLAKGIAEP